MGYGFQIYCFNNIIPKWVLMLAELQKTTTQNRPPLCTKDKTLEMEA